MSCADNNVKLVQRWAGHKKSWLRWFLKRANYFGFSTKIRNHKFALCVVYTVQSTLPNFSKTGFTQEDCSTKIKVTSFVSPKYPIIDLGLKAFTENLVTDPQTESEFCSPFKIVLIP